MADIALRRESHAQPIAFTAPPTTARREPIAVIADRFRAGSLTEQYAVALSMIAIVGAVDYFTGIEISIAFCYLLPIYLLASTRGRTGALVGALTSVLARLPVVHQLPVDHHALGTFLWNLLVDLVLFLVIGFAFAAWRAADQRAADRELQLRDDLMATVSHDLKNPLGVVLLASARLRDQATTGEPCLRDVDTIRRAAKKMNALISDLLDVARFQNGRLFVDVRPHDVAPLLSESFDVVQALAESRGVRLSVEVTPDAPGEIRCDRARIGQVLSNLVGNAIRYTPARGAVIVRASRSEGGVQVSVIDEGPGVDPADVDHVFERFWQAGTKRRSGGSAGLGLPIARSIVEAHGGRIWVERVPTGGSAFCFTVP